MHGLVGNVHALRTTLDRERAERLEAETNEVLSRLAVREDGLANWPPAAGDGLEHHRTGEIRLQWCHGAPGIVATTAPYLDEELVLAGAELTWRAGAHREQKGAGICHGTAGNGYALLAAFERTGDELWLDRARRFAVHALAQAEREAPLYALWMGAIGVARLRVGLPRRAVPLPLPRRRGRALTLYQRHPVRVQPRQPTLPQVLADDPADITIAAGEQTLEQRLALLGQGDDRHAPGIAERLPQRPERVAAAIVGVLPALP